jgi:hypothetical protein
MLTVDKDTKEAPNKWWAAQDARMRNYANKSRWDSKIQRRVDAMMMALDSIYSGRIYEAYGVRRVAIKIDSPQVKDRKWLRILEADWSAEGITKTVTPRGILYQIAKL